VINESIINIFNTDELELILNGQPFIDVWDWKANTIYTGYSESTNVKIN
jgi:E3 ubiquitin-protein ligase HUWE1